MIKTRFDCLLGKDIPVIDPPIYLLPCCNSKYPLCNSLINNNCTCTCLQHIMERLSVSDPINNAFKNDINIINNILSSKSKSLALINMRHTITPVQIIANFILGIDHCKFNLSYN